MAGWPSFALAAMLRDEMPRHLTRLVERGSDPRRVEALARVWASIRKAADEWAAAAASAATAPDPELLARSDPEVDTATAAAALGVTPGRIRQRCRSGSLPGRTVRGRWWIVASAVRAACEE